MCNALKSSGAVADAGVCALCADVPDTATRVGSDISWPSENNIHQMFTNCYHHSHHRSMLNQRPVYYYYQYRQYYHQVV